MTLTESDLPHILTAVQNRIEFHHDRIAECVRSRKDRERHRQARDQYREIERRLLELQP